MNDYNIEDIDTEIPMSNSINDLDNRNEFIPVDNNINLDEIINDQNILDNNFIRDTVENIESNNNNIPTINLVFKHYFNNILSKMYCKKNSNKIIVLLIRIIHILSLVFVLFGIFFPKKLLKYHILWCLHILILYDILDNRNYMNIIASYLNKNETKNEFIPIDIYVSKTFILIVMFISIFGLAYPEISIFNLTENIINKFKNLN